MPKNSRPLRQIDPGDDDSPPTGMPYDPMVDVELKRRFEAKFRANDYGCWVWQAHADKKDGYGQFKVNGVVQRAHRASWMIYRGPIEPGLDIDHKCDKVEGGPERPNRRCVNPEHLEPVTHAENLSRMRESGAAARGEDFITVPISPELIVEWAEDMVEESGFVITGHIHVQSAVNTPWRKQKHAFEEGLRSEDAAWALVALFLYTVQLGVDWKLGALRLLHMNPLSLYRWNENEEWKTDFALAKQMARAARWSDLEESLLDDIERRSPKGELKDVVSALKAVNARNERHLTALARSQQPERPLLGNNVYIMLPAGGTLEEALSVIDGTARDVTNENLMVPPLPPPAEWEQEQFEEEEPK